MALRRGAPPAPGAPNSKSLGNPLGAPGNDEYHFSFKVVVLGDPGVGKTTLLEGEGGTRDNPITSSKIGVNFFRKYYVYRKQTYRIEYWDCPGASRYVPLARHFTSGAAAALVLFDKNNRASFEHVQNVWLRAVESSWTSIIPMLVGTTTGYASPEARARGYGQTSGGMMGLDDGALGSQLGLESDSNYGDFTADNSKMPVTDAEARDFAKRYGLEYINADPLARDQPDFATPTGVFEFVFSSIVGSLPRLAEPSLLLQRGVKLGSLLLGDREYQQKLYTIQTNSRPALPSSSKKNASLLAHERRRREIEGATKVDSGSNQNLQGQRAYQQKRDHMVIGDENLDLEGVVPERSDRQIREMSRLEDDFVGSRVVSVDAGEPKPGQVRGRRQKGKSNVVTHYMQSKSWHTTARRSRPQGAEDRSKDPIEHSLMLEHVHGFRGQDCRNNVAYTKDGALVYTAAALAICVDPKSMRQRYMSGHTDDIISLAMTPVIKKRGSYSICATGEVGRTPKIIVWESNTMRQLQTLNPSHERGVTQLAFSPDGMTLASIGLDDQNSMSLHDWKKGVSLLRVRTGPDKVFGLSFQHDTEVNPLDDSRIVTVGFKHMTFWKRSGKSQISPRNARFGRDLAGTITIVDVCFDAIGRIITATQKGHICVWPPKDANTMMLPLGKGSIKNAHRGPMNCVETIPGGEKFVSAGVDGLIKIWICHQSPDRVIELSKTFDTHQKFCLNPAVQSVGISSNKARAILGTRGGDIVEIKLQDGSLLKNRPVTSGHNFGELWGLAAHPHDSNIFATCGDDKTVRLWHIRKRMCILANKSEPLVDMARAIAFSPRKGDFMAVGIGGRVAARVSGLISKNAGKVVMVSTKNLKFLATFKVAKEMISEMCFSRNGSTLAVASHDNIIYLLTVNGPTDVQPKARCRGHSSFVSHISMSYDSQWLMSNDGSGEILYWDVNTGDQETRLDKIKNVSWPQNTCPLSWQMQGIWPSNGDLTDVNACMARGVGVSGMEGPPGYGMIVTADDFGKIKMFNSPSLRWCAPSIVHRGHSAHVTNLCFNSDGSRVISVGGNDRCIFVWRVIQNKPSGGTFGSRVDN